MYSDSFRSCEISFCDVYKGLGISVIGLCKWFMQMVGVLDLVCGVPVVAI